MTGSSTRGGRIQTIPVSAGRAYPRRLGTGGWTRSEAKLDPEIAQIAGSSDHIIRNYIDERTGETSRSWFFTGSPRAYLFIPRKSAIPRPDSQSRRPMNDHELTIPGSNKLARYRRGYFAKKLIAGNNEYTEVVYSFRHAGEWMPGSQDRWKMFRYHPGMFKVQIADTCRRLDRRRIARASTLLEEFMQEIENRLARGEGSPAASRQTGLNGRSRAKSRTEST